MVAALDIRKTDIFAVIQIIFILHVLVVGADKRITAVAVNVQYGTRVRVRIPCKPVCVNPRNVAHKGRF